MYVPAMLHLRHCDAASLRTCRANSQSQPLPAHGEEDAEAQGHGEEGDSPLLTSTGGGRSSGCTADPPVRSLALHLSCTPERTHHPVLSFSDEERGTSK